MIRKFYVSLTHFSSFFSHHFHRSLTLLISIEFISLHSSSWSISLSFTQQFLSSLLSVFHYSFTAFLITTDALFLCLTYSFSFLAPSPLHRLALQWRVFIALFAFHSLLSSWTNRAKGIRSICKKNWHKFWLLISCLNRTVMSITSFVCKWNRESDLEGGSAGMNIECVRELGGKANEEIKRDIKWIGKSKIENKDKSFVRDQIRL